MATETPLPENRKRDDRRRQQARDRHGLSAQFFWLVAAVMLVTGAVTVGVLVQLRASEIAKAEQLGQSMAQVVEEQTSRTLQAVDLGLQLAAKEFVQMSERRELTQDATRAALRAYQQELPFVRALWVVNASGHIAYSSEEGSIGADRSDRAYFTVFQTLEHSGFYLGDPILSRSSGQWVISASRPLYSSKGVFIGVIAASLLPNYLDQVWNKVRIYPEDSVSLFRRDATLIMRSPLPTGVLGKKFPDAPLFQEPHALQPSGNFLTTARVDNIPRLYAYRTVTQYPDLRLSIGQAQGGLLAHWRQMAWAAGATWVLGSIGLAALAMVLQRESRRRTRSEMQRLEVFARITDAFVAVDRNFNYTYANRHAAEIMQLRPEQIIGKNMWDGYLQNDSPPFKTACEQALAKQESAHLDAHFKKSDRWFKVNIYPSRDGLTIYFRDITEAKQAEVQLRALSNRVLEVQETERRRIAHELHDELGQSLTAVKINLQAGDHFKTSNPAQRYAENIRIVDQALQHVRSMSLALRPSVLDDLGLTAALEWLVEQATARDPLKIEFFSTLGEDRLPSPVETAFFRIAQEALTNIQRYAQASHVVIRLDRDVNGLSLSVKDDGRGFDVASLRASARGGKSLGLLGMQERAQLVGGTFDLTTAAGQGCTVTVHCACHEEPPVP